MTEQQNVDAAEVDFIIGSLAGPLCAGGGFCAGSDEIVEHQRISAASYTFSAALPAMLATTASETINMLQTSPDIMVLLREHIKAMRAQLDPRSDWVYCTSTAENPIMILPLKPEVVTSKGLNVDEQERLLQDIIDEVRSSFTDLPRCSLSPLNLRFHSRWQMASSSRELRPSVRGPRPHRNVTSGKRPLR